MKIELGQFYLGSHDTVFVLYEEGATHYEGRAWQGGLTHRITISKTHPIIDDAIPIEPAIATLIQSSQIPPTSPIDSPIF